MLVVTGRGLTINFVRSRVVIFTQNLLWCKLLMGGSRNRRICGNLCSNCS